MPEVESGELLEGGRMAAVCLDLPLWVSPPESLHARVLTEEETGAEEETEEAERR